MEKRDQYRLSKRCSKDDLSIDELMNCDEDEIVEYMDKFELDEKAVLNKTKKMIGIEKRNRHKSKKFALASMINDADSQIHMLESRQFSIQILAIIIFFILFPFAFIVNSEFSFFHLSHEIDNFEKMGDYSLILMFASISSILLCIIYVTTFRMKIRSFEYRSNILNLIGIVNYDQDHLYQRDRFCLMLSSPIINGMIFLMPASAYSFFAWKLAGDDESVMRVFMIALIFDLVLIFLAFTVWRAGLSHIRRPQGKQGRKGLVEKPSNAEEGAGVQVPGGPQAWRGPAYRRSARSEKFKDGHQSQAGCTA